MNKTIILQGLCSPEFVNVYRSELIHKQIHKHSRSIDSFWNDIINNYLNIDLKNNIMHIFTSFLEDDIEVGNVFSRVNSINNRTKNQKIESRIIGLIDSISLLPVDKIYKGHKSICVIQANEIFELPTIDGFHMNKGGTEIELIQETF